jgi:cell division protein FtsN
LRNTYYKNSLSLHEGLFDEQKTACAMNRIITILVTIFILLLLYIWISHVWGSDKPRHPRQIVDAKENQLSDELMADADTTMYTQPASQDTMATEVDNDEYATERNVAPQEEVKTEPAKSEPVKNEPVAEKKAQETKKPNPPKTEPKKTTTAPAAKPVSTTPKTETKPAAPSTPATGQHLVIAGNFTQKVNAEQRVQELKKAGFPDAEVVNFDLSEYHTVCVGRFNDVNEARKLVKKLKDYHKIDAYVRIGG